MAIQKKRVSVAKVLITIIVAILLLCVLVVIGFNAYMRVSYASFYQIAKAEFNNPALATGFIPQDLDYVESADTWIFSGYKGEDAASPLVKISSDGAISSLVVQEPDGDVYTGHGGGVSSTDEYVYLTADYSYLVIPLSEVLAASDGDTVQAVAQQPLDLDPAFLNIEDGVLYTGVFYREGPYSTPEEMHITTPDGTENGAVMYAYPADEDAPYGFALKAACVFSIPDQVQGVCYTPEGNLMFSISWGLEPSHYPVYDAEALLQDGTYEADGEAVPLYCLDGRTLIGDLAGPPMAEGIDGLDGRIYISNESASNKYFYGKLMGGQAVYSLPGDIEGQL